MLHVRHRVGMRGRPPLRALRRSNVRYWYGCTSARVRLGHIVPLFSHRVGIYGRPPMCVLRRPASLRACAFVVSIVGGPALFPQTLGAISSSILLQVYDNSKMRNFWGGRLSVPFSAVLRFFGAGAVSYDGSAITGEHPLGNVTTFESFRWTAAAPR
jgi:hypothetical protein